MRIHILAGRETAYKGEARMVVLPGLDGEFSVLDFHQPFLYRLRKGFVKIIGPEAKLPEESLASGQKEELIPLKDGLARFDGNSLLILCEKE